MNSALFSPFSLREIEFKNRIFVSPMCQYSSRDGAPTQWHLVHLGSRAVGGAACVIQEATAVTAEGRISPGDAGIWNDAQAEAYKPIVKFLKDNGAVPGIQLAHAGRKASTRAPWDKGPALSEREGGWIPVAPSAIAFSDAYLEPRALGLKDIRDVVDAFAAAASRALTAGYEVAEIHAAHGYLVHEFLSPLANRRTDEYGGNLENRMRFAMEIVSAVREAWPEPLPVFVRISATDWAEGGWDIGQSILLASRLKEIGIDLIDVSSGGTVPHVRIPTHPGYQVPFAAAIKERANIACGAVGLITSPEQAEQIVATRQADIVLLARETLRNPYWPLHAAHVLGAEIKWPQQYERAKPR
jgi:2,4-dienoyl-CoA reductase-like NADH-dependent reductase (Old Yellow Enzyme family)